VASRNDIMVIHNGVDLELYSRIYREVTINTGSRSLYEIAFLGDLNWEYYMLDRIIEGFSVAGNKGLAIRLKIIGDGATRRRPENIARKLRIQGMVSLKGYLDRETLVRELIASDLAITGRPLSRDLWNLTSMRSTIYEYIGAGLPILSFGPEHSYIERFIKHHSLGLYIGSIEPEDIGESIAVMIVD
jgi:glycosyltransferase involved in cell wall biosynthesis